SPILSLAAAQYPVGLLLVLAQRGDGHRHRRAGADLVDAGQDRGRDGGDGAAARLANREHRRLGRLADYLDLRECRRDPGGHDDHRPADHADRPARRRDAESNARRDQFRERALRLRTRERRDRRPEPDGAAGRKDRPDRPFRRRQVDEFIRELEDWKQRRGYTGQVGERGVKLSGGQRQRIAIARVILKDAPILVLDEATSALDSEVEAAIQSSLGTLMAGKTVIAIAHRLSTIARMDRLIVLERGRIVEQGSHDELLRHGGHYAALWRRQSGGFIDADMQAAERTAA